MNRIIALNDEVDKIEAEEEEVVATKEAQETIAESEYVRAMKLKTEQKTDLCLELLNELLETQVLNENIKSSNNEKLLIIKYNCHKNIAIILEERSEFNRALQHYIAAILIDNTDVFTLNKFGQLALKLNANDLAEYAFENCLARNAEHWSAAEGMLQVMNKNHNILGAYRWANKICSLDPYSQKAKQTLKEISKLFKENISFYEKCSGMRMMENEEDVEMLAVNGEDNSPFRCLFDGELDEKNYGENKVIKTEELPDLKKFNIKPLSWLTVGQFVLDLYESLKKEGHNMLFTFDFQQIIENTSVKEEQMDLTDTTMINQNKVEGNEGEMELNTKLSEVNADTTKQCTGTEPADVISLDSNNSDSDSNAKSDGGETNRSKPRRRCSDLHFLEQWGWHKSRRYAASRKKNERDEIDTSLNTYLRKILSKYTEQNFEEKWPFNELTKNESLDKECQTCNIKPTNETFQEATQEEFNKFMEKLKNKPVDMMVLIYKWLKYMANTWNVAMPREFKTLYVKIFNIYMLHFDLTNWNQLSNNNYEASSRLCLFYLELSMISNINYDSELWLKVFQHLMFNKVNFQMITDQTKMEIYELRLIYLEYLLFNEKLQFQSCLLSLQRMLDIFANQNSEFILHLPNSNKVCINIKFLEMAQLQYKRQININSIPKLYEKESWSELANIIINSIETSTNNYYNEQWLQDFRIEMELLLQAYWKLENYDKCLQWSEKFLHYSVAHYLEESKSPLRQKLLADLINFILTYIEAIIINEGYHIVMQLKEDSLSRLVQNIIRILVYQHEGNFDKNSLHGQDLDFKRPWILLHQLILKDENDAPSTLNAKSEDTDDVSELIPNSFLILFTAHEYLGKRQWCTNDNGDFLQYILDAVVFNLRAPIYDVCRDVIYEYIEQVTYCLIKYPQKRARSRHLEEHEAQQIKLTWPKAMQIFDLYRPEDLPEFNSYKLESITSDMEQLLIKIVSLMPKELDPSNSIHYVNSFIEGLSNLPPSEANAFKMPYKIISLFYLLADYYFKNRDFSKAIKYYTLDLAVNPTRFDSWAGMALSKASKIETTLNALDPINLDTLWLECEKVLRCFECCINLNRFQTLLWIEYGSFSYIIHSYFSRFLKNKSNNEAIKDLSQLIEERKKKMLTIAYNCFSCANSLQNSSPGANTNEDSNADADEKWLCQYMLGKVSEKRKEPPNVYLNHYLMAANYLYENGATYPIKINHSNPTSLSVEALEVFYRTNAAIIKFMENEKEISRQNGNLFNKILKNLANSPFAYNKAKIDGNSLNILKGKLYNNKQFKTPGNNQQKQNDTNTNVNAAETIQNPEQLKINETNKDKDNSGIISQTSSLNPSAAITLSSAISSDSSTIESDSDSESETDSKNDVPYSKEELKTIYQMVIQNIEECATRFPEHYKSIYRLIYHYINSTPEYCDFPQCEQLLLGQYKTNLGNMVNGLFYDRKNNNLFNGIWRIPSSEIDRPGSFSTHLVKCVDIFIKLLYKMNNHKILIDIALNLYKIPDLDKRYIMDTDRKQLYQQSISYCVDMLKAILLKNQENRDDIETLNLLIDIYKIHKKCVKYMNQKEQVFTELLVDVYKFFIKDKIENIPENCNFLDLAIKLCIQEITAQKSNEKSNTTDLSTNTSDFIITQSQLSSNLPAATRTYHIPGLTQRPKTKLSSTKNFLSSPSSSYVDDNPSFNVFNPASMNVFNPASMKSPLQQVMPMMSLFGGNTNLSGNEAAEFQKLFEEYYAKLLESSKNQELQKQHQQQQQQIMENSLSITASTSSAAATSTTSTQDVTKMFPSIFTNENLMAPTKSSYAKAKSSMKSPKTQYKPYNRPAEPEKAPEGPFKTFNMETFNNHNNIMQAYTNLLQNTATTMPQIDYTNKLFGPAGRKPKSSLQQSNNSNTNMFTVNPHDHLQSVMMSSSDSIAVSSPSLQAATNTFSSTGMMHTSNFPPTSMQNYSHPQFMKSEINISPTKTLQEKLAERQKACQLNESNTTSSSAAVKMAEDKSSCSDVIILD